MALLHASYRPFLLFASTFLAIPAVATAQDDPPAPTEDEVQGPSAPELPQKLAWPRDVDRVVCRVGSDALTLGDLVDHIGERHFPGMRALMDTDAGRGFLESPLAATWVRQFADVVALEREAKQRGIEFGDVRDELGAALKRAFQAWLDDYTARREQRGHPVELTQERVDLLLTDFQRRQGLRTEVRGWLDAMVPAVDPDDSGRLRAYYNDHAPYFGGVVSIAQIFVRHRDPRTLELLRGPARQAAYDKLQDIRERLEDDGSNFEEIARRFSDDRVTAGKGGRMQGIRRFDERLPAALCRTAWKLEDGEVSAPVESAYGIHIVKRLGYRHLYYVIFNDEVKREVAATMRQEGQEDLLWKVREKFHVQLRY